MINSSLRYTTANFEQFNGFADIYDKYRPVPPTVIVDILIQLAQQSRPSLVVDLGCGTGLSTRLWEGRAKKVIGIEPNTDMRSKAEEQSKKISGIFYMNGTTTDTHLPDESVDIVTICQALHWVEPIKTFKEVHRMLRSGGIFAAIDYDLPSTTTLEINEAEKNFLDSTKQLMHIHGFDRTIKLWDKDKHLNRMESSKQFMCTKEIAICNRRLGDVDQIVGLNLSHGNTQTLLKNGLSEEQIGLSTLREKILTILGKTFIPMYITYRIRVGQK